MHHLTPGEVLDLMVTYQEMHRRLASLKALFEEEKQHARVARKLSVFLPMSSWQPQSCPLNPEEAHMLQRGDAFAICYHHVFVAGKAVS